MTFHSAYIVRSYSYCAACSRQVRAHDTSSKTLPERASHSNIANDLCTSRVGIAQLVSVDGAEV